MRLALAASLSSAPPSLLILDEPTQHLDLAAIEALAIGLNAWGGALLLSSHDRSFLREVEFDAVWVMSRGSVSVTHLARHDGDHGDDADACNDATWEQIFASLAQPRANGGEANRALGT